MSPCNCGSGSKNTRIVWQLTEPNGRKRSYATQAEALRAKERLGGEVKAVR